GRIDTDGKSCPVGGGFHECSMPHFPREEFWALCHRKAKSALQVFHNGRRTRMVETACSILLPVPFLRSAISAKIRSDITSNRRSSGYFGYDRGRNICHRRQSNIG